MPRCRASKRRLGSNVYLDYGTYAELGGALEEERFDQLEPTAEVILDNWTLNRLRSEEVAPDGNVAQSVHVAMRILVDALPSIEEADRSAMSAQQLTGFSNGITSLDFASERGQGERALSSAYNAVTRVLPIELCSTCTAYNHAG